MLRLGAWKQLSQKVSGHVLSKTIYELDRAIFNHVADEVPPNIDMFCSGMKLPLRMSKCDGRLTVRIKNNGCLSGQKILPRRRWNQINSLAVCMAVTHSALAVDKVMSSCFFEHQETAPPSIRMTYL